MDDCTEILMISVFKFGFGSVIFFKSAQITDGIPRKKCNIQSKMLIEFRKH